MRWAAVAAVAPKESPAASPRASKGCLRRRCPAALSRTTPGYNAQRAEGMCHKVRCMHRQGAFCSSPLCSHAGRLTHEYKPALRLLHVHAKAGSDALSVRLLAPGDPQCGHVIRELLGPQGLRRRALGVLQARRVVVS